ncbi:hypothetical protein FOXG_17255 [Fusarium oxysporum f. sp. lycopersici 4287]|uniref:Uncharacterized protein n=2 Tax=Fusarium oxysporum TaxID=5507 RepID=A0A0J9WVR7_FUSO4|nr:hypothetical protein FOXG_17255 [Fusarium oxysporum f. sp. lycopersici 4287]KNB20002.1 hypothetical protein FOXG_17255 [Fusarium oxysporum f. sp. lycopersici 4287]
MKRHEKRFHRDDLEKKPLAIVPPRPRVSRMIRRLERSGQGQFARKSGEVDSTAPQRWDVILNRRLEGFTLVQVAYTANGDVIIPAEAPPSLLDVDGNELIRLHANLAGVKCIVPDEKPMAKSKTSRSIN